ncbi:MAG: CbtB domain-containing protein [Nitrososphaerales archaeon]
MSNKQITVEEFRIPILAVGILLTILFFGMFIVGYDQGHLLGTVFGQKAYEENFLHEAFHDMRHTAGFPCH